MFTFNVILGYQGLLFRDFLWSFFLGVFFFFNPKIVESEVVEVEPKEKKKREPHSSST